MAETTIDFRMPSLGADMESGTLVEWRVKPGDRVEKGQIVAVVETHKGAIDIEIFDEGEVVELLVPVDTEVPVGTVLAHLRGEAKAQQTATPAPATMAPAPTVASTPTPELRVSPRARRRAEELGVDLRTFVGTDHPISTEDIERAASQRGTAPPTGMRAAIAAAMARSKREIPHYYLWHTLDLEPLLVWLGAENERRSVAERVLPIAPLVRAVALALRDFPQLGGDPRGIHVGLAVALHDGGLVNPALHDADKGTLPELMAKIADVTRRARAGGLRASELADARITVTSLGDQGTDGVLGIIHPPQTAIVGFGTIAERPWVVDHQTGGAARGRGEPVGGSPRERRAPRRAIPARDRAPAQRTRGAVSRSCGGSSPPCREGPASDSNAARSSVSRSTSTAAMRSSVSRWVSSMSRARACASSRMPLDLLVDLARGGLASNRAAPARSRRGPGTGRRTGGAQCASPSRSLMPNMHDHLPREGGGLAQVVLRRRSRPRRARAPRPRARPAGRRAGRSSSARVARNWSSVGQLHRVAERGAPARHDADLVHRVAVLAVVRRRARGRTRG